MSENVKNFIAPSKFFLRLWPNFYRYSMCGRSQWRFVMDYFRPLEHWDHGFESQSSHGCLHLFCVWVVMFRADLRPRSLTDSLRNKKLKWNKAFHECPMFPKLKQQERERESMFARSLQRRNWLEFRWMNVISFFSPWKVSSGANKSSYQECGSDNKKRKEIQKSQNIKVKEYSVVIN
jgi:hypothetical protein